MTGYMHPDYAQSLAEFGDPRELPRCGGWILERQIPGFPYRDGMGCYPLFVCRDWSQLHLDLDDLSDELVSLSMVTDPFGKYDSAYLHRCFKDVVIPFKKHYIADLHRPINDIISSHRRRDAQRARNRGISVEECENPMQFIEDWMALHSTLAERHNIKGIKAFSRKAFVKQFNIPGLVMLRSVHQGATVGMATLFIQGNVAQAHVASFSDNARKLGVSSVLYRSIIEYLSDRVRWIDWGGGAGVKYKGKDSLSRFKQGWATETRTAYFCGRIFDHKKYSEIVKATGSTITNYFPAYRGGEFR
jgi:hypothetical protein